MGGKSKGAPAPPPPVQEPAVDPMAMMAPMVEGMQAMMAQFAQQQQNMLSFLSQDMSPPNPDAYAPSAFDLEAHRADIQEQLAKNPTKSAEMQRGIGGTQRVSPLEDEDDAPILNVTPRKGSAV